MDIFLLIIFFIAAIAIVFWQGSLLFVAIFGAPTVYAKSEAMIDAFNLARVKKGELVIDLGCGNAKSLLIAAKRFGAKGVGAEISPFCYLKSRLNVFLAGEGNNIKILFGDFSKAEKYLSQADVIYLYLLEKVLADIEPWLFKGISPKTRIVSLSFKFTLKKPLAVKQTSNLGKKTKIYLYKK